MPDLTRPDGVLNLASRLPTNGYRPVLGPQLYCAYSSSDESTLGTTKLHVDVIDALNILVHASRQKGYTVS